MPAVRPDGATTPVDQPDAWDSVFAEGRAVGDDAPLGSGDDLDGGSPQQASDGLSDGSPDAPLPDPTGDDGAARARSAPLDADPAGASPANAGAPATPSDTDPLAGAQPFTFSVGDETRTIEGAYRLPGDGLYVPEDKVPQFELMASRAETLDRQHRDLSDQHSTLVRLTQWPSKNADGSDRMLSGREGLEAQRVVLAQSLSRDTSTWKFLEDPAKLVSLVTVQPTGRQYEDGSPEYALVPNKTALDALKRDVAADARDTVYVSRQHFQTLGAPQPAPEPTVADRAMPTIDAQLSAMKLTLGAEDKQFLAEQLQRYVRPTTPAEKQAGQGAQIVDASFLKLIERTAAQAQAVTKAATAGKRTDQFNGGMDKGRQGTAPRRPATPAAPPTFTGRNAPKPRTDPSPNDMWATLIEDAKTASV